MLIVIRVFYIISLLLYTTAAVAYIRDFRSSGGPGTRRGRAVFVSYGALFHFIGIATCAFYLRQAPFMGMLQGFGFSALVLALLFLHIGRSLENPTGLGMVVLPLVALFAALGIFAPLQKMTDPLLAPNPWFIVHASIALFSYGAFAVGFAGAALYIVLHREIKGKHLGRVFQRLPSLGELDHMTYLAVSLGFVALTVSIITGMVWTSLRLGSLLQLDIKEVITFGNWFVYAFYLHSRYYGRWKGRRSAWLAVIGFMLVLFNFLIVTALSSTHGYM